MVGTRPCDGTLFLRRSVAIGIDIGPAPVPEHWPDRRYPPAPEGLGTR